MRRLLPTILLLLAVPAWAAISVRILVNPDDTVDSNFPIDAKPADSGGELPAPWNRCTIDGAVLTFDEGSNSVEEVSGVFTVSSVSGSVAITGSTSADDHIDAPCQTVNTTTSDISIRARIVSEATTGDPGFPVTGLMIREDNSSPGAEYIFSGKIGTLGMRIRQRATTDASAVNLDPTPFSTEITNPHWQWWRCDSDVSECNLYVYFSASDPGSDPDVNWTFVDNFSVPFIGTATAAQAMLVTSPSDTADEGDTIATDWDNVSVDFATEISLSPGTIDFSALTYPVEEDDGTVTITATRTGAGSGAASVSLTLTDGTAVEGTDYTDGSCTFSWADTVTGDDTCAVTITDRDSVVQGNTSFTATLTEVSAAETVSADTATITIQDLDVASGGFAANSPSYTPIVPGAAGFGFDWDVANLPDFDDPYHVTTLDSGTGPGTFRAAVTGTWTGCRVVVFDVSGTILYPEETVFTTTDDCLIVAGQTAPSPGIVIAGAFWKISSSEVLVWHMTLLQDKFEDTSSIAQKGDVVQITGGSTVGAATENVVIMNTFAAFGSDELIGTWNWVSNVSFYQSAIGWPLTHECGSGCVNPDSKLGSLTYIRSTPTDWTRMVCANVTSRCPRALSGGSMLNSVAMSKGRGWETGHSATINYNIEESLFIKGPYGSDAPIYAHTDIKCASRIFSDDNRGMGGLADPPPITNASCLDADGDPVANSAGDVFSDATARIDASYPAGYTLHDVGATAGAETAALQLIVSCNGPRPLDRIPLVQEFYDEVLSEGSDGELIDDPDDVGPAGDTGIPDLDANITSHSDIPADPNAAGTHINAIMDWLVTKSNALLPTGAGCN